MKLEIWLHNKSILMLANGRLVEYDEGIRLFREVKGWTRNELAYYLGISVRTVESWETGRIKNPNKSALLLIKSFLAD